MTRSGRLVLLRHGESTLNRDDRFSGWADCPLTPKGMRQAHAAGRALRAAGCCFDDCFTSVLSRAAETAAIVLAELGQAELPVTRSWRLNERHYGALEGTPKRAAAVRFGAAQVEAWRNGAEALPPPLAEEDARHPRWCGAYGEIAPGLLPSSESLRDAFARVVAYFTAEILPCVEAGHRVLVVTHGNPVRALVAHLAGMGAGDVPLIAVRNATPLVYDLDAAGRQLRPTGGVESFSREGGGFLVF